MGVLVRRNGVVSTSKDGWQAADGKKARVETARGNLKI